MPYKALYRQRPRQQPHEPDKGKPTDTVIQIRNAKTLERPRHLDTAVHRGGGGRCPGNAIVPFYGAGAGTALTNLLKQHIMIAVDLVAAAKTNNQAKFAEEDRKWTKNAEEIATFLSGANPNWPKADLVDLLGQHLSLTKAEAVARLTKEWDDDVKAFDDIFTEILTVADALSDGIVKQFPNKFQTR